MRRIVLFLVIFFTVLASATDRVTFTVFARIQFTIPGDWPVISSKSDAAQTVFAFQIPNPSDQDTDDSTNLVIISYWLKDSKSNAAFERKAADQNPNAKEGKLVDDWNCSSFSDHQGSTRYEIWDCHRTIAGSGVYVRLAWPHLPNNPSSYDDDMKSTLADFLRSVVPSQQK